MYVETPIQRMPLKNKNNNHNQKWNEIQFQFLWSILEVFELFDTFLHTFPPAPRRLLNKFFSLCSSPTVLSVWRSHFWLLSWCYDTRYSWDFFFSFLFEQIAAWFFYSSLFLCFFCCCCIFLMFSTLGTFMSVIIYSLIRFNDLWRLCLSPSGTTNIKTKTSQGLKLEVPQWQIPCKVTGVCRVILLEFDSIMIWRDDDLCWSVNIIINP